MQNQCAHKWVEILERDCLTIALYEISIKDWIKHYRFYYRCKMCCETTKQKPVIYLAWSLPGQENEI